MRIKFWPSGHSNDYSLILLFNAERDAVKNRRRLAARLNRLGLHCNGSPSAPYRLQNAFFVDYELDQDEGAVDAHLDFESWLKDQLKVRISEIGSPAVHTEPPVHLKLVMPRKSELVLMNPDQIALVKKVISAAGGEGMARFGSEVAIQCGLPDGDEKVIWLRPVWETAPIRLLKSTFRNVRLATPVGEFPIGRQTESGER